MFKHVFKSFFNLVFILFFIGDSMKTNLNKKEAQEKIDNFFKREDFTAKEAKKIKRLAMKFNIKLGLHKRAFCKKCFSRLEGKFSINKMYKTIECKNCGYKNKIRIS